MSAVTGAWNHDDVVTLLTRETVWRRDQVQPVVLRLAALGWTQHQVLRGFRMVARSGFLTFDSLWQGAELAGGDVDAFLDALAGGHDADD